MNPFTVLATAPSRPAEELAPLRAAGLDVVIGRPLDTPGRRPWSEADLIEAVRAADVVLAHEVPAHVVNPAAIPRWRARRS